MCRAGPVRPVRAHLPRRRLRRHPIGCAAAQLGGDRSAAPADAGRERARLARSGRRHRARDADRDQQRTPVDPTLGQEAALTSFDQWGHGACGFTRLDITNTATGLTGVPPALPAGTASVSFTNRSPAAKAGFILLVGRVMPGAHYTLAAIRANKVDLTTIADIRRGCSAHSATVRPTPRYGSPRATTLSPARSAAHRISAASPPASSTSADACPAAPSRRLGLCRSRVQPEPPATTETPATASRPGDHGDPDDIPRLPAIRSQRWPGKQATACVAAPSTYRAASTPRALGRSDAVPAQAQAHERQRSCRSPRAERPCSCRRWPAAAIASARGRARALVRAGYRSGGSLISHSRRAWPHLRAGSARDTTANCRSATAGCAGRSSMIATRVHAGSRCAWPGDRCARCCA